MTPPRILDATDTAARLDFGALVAAIERAALDHERGAIRCPARTVVPLAGDATLLSMPAAADDVAIHKLITVAPANRRADLPTIQGSMTVIDPSNGNTLLVLDGPTVTGRRTAAVSMCAFARLADDPRDVLLIGTGAQAQHHVDAMAALRPDVRLRVRGTSRDAVERFCRANRDRVPDVDHASDEAEEAAAVVITCTTSPVPVYRHPARSGTLVIAVGSFRPQNAEIDAATVRASAIVVDDLEGARHEAGDLIQAGIAWDAVTTLAAVVEGRRSDKTAPATRPWLFKSVGCSAWDLAAARVALRAD